MGVLGGREAALPHLIGVFARCCADLVAEAAIALDEFRGELGKEAEHVVDHQDLPVAGRRAADPDRRHPHRGAQLGASLSATPSMTSAKAPAAAIAMPSRMILSRSPGAWPGER